MRPSPRRLPRLTRQPSPVQGEPTPDWVPYTTAPATDPTFGSQPTPPAGASYDAPYVPPAVSAAPGPVPPAPGQGSYQQPQQPPQPQQPYGGYAAPYGQTPHAGPGAVPPQQPYYGYQQPYYQQPYQQPVRRDEGPRGRRPARHLPGRSWASTSSTWATTPPASSCWPSPSWAACSRSALPQAVVMWVIAVIEGVLYLTKSQTEFEQIVRRQQARVVLGWSDGCEAARSLTTGSRFCSVAGRLADPPTPRSKAASALDRLGPTPSSRRDALRQALLRESWAPAGRLADSLRQPGTKSALLGRDGSCEALCREWR